MSVTPALSEGASRLRLLSPPSCAESQWAPTILDYFPGAEAPCIEICHPCLILRYRYVHTRPASIGERSQIEQALKAVWLSHVNILLQLPSLPVIPATQSSREPGLGFYPCRALLAGSLSTAFVASLGELSTSLPARLTERHAPSRVTSY